MGSTVLRCPFCGNFPILESYSDLGDGEVDGTVSCSIVGCPASFGESPLEQWNMRHPQEELLEPLLLNAMEWQQDFWEKFQLNVQKYQDSKKMKRLKKCKCDHNETCEFCNPKATP